MVFILHPSKNKLVLSAKLANRILFTQLGIATIMIYQGANTAIQNPQILTEQEQIQIYNAGYAQQPFVAAKKNTAYGLLQMGLGGLIGYYGLALLAYEKPKNRKQVKAVVPDFPIPPAIVQSVDEKQKQEKIKESVENIKKSALEAYIYKVFKECPWVESLMEAQGIVYVGEGGAGKSRTAMCISLCQLIYRGEYCSAIGILDSQGSKNIESGTWVAGNVHEYSAIPGLLAMIKGDDRKSKSPFQAILVDEAARLSRDVLTLPILKAAMASCKEDARSRNRCFHFTAHSWMKGEWGGDSTVSLRSAMFRAVKVLYFPAKKSKTGKLQKTDLVLIRDGIDDSVQVPQRISNDDDRFNYAEDWEIHAIPDWLDPAHMLEALELHIRALQNEVKVIGKEEKVLDARVAAHLRNQIQSNSDQIVNMIDVDAASLQRQNAELIHDFGGFMRPPVINAAMLSYLNEQEVNFLCEFKPKKPLKVDDYVIIDSREVPKDIDLSKLYDDGYGLLSASKKYWIQPKIKK